MSGSAIPAAALDALDTEITTQVRYLAHEFAADVVYRQEYPADWGQIEPEGLLGYKGEPASVVKARAIDLLAIVHRLTEETGWTTAKAAATETWEQMVAEEVEIIKENKALHDAQFKAEIAEMDAAAAARTEAERAVDAERRAKMARMTGEEFAASFARSCMCSSLKDAEAGIEAALHDAKTFEGHVATGNTALRDAVLTVTKERDLVRAAVTSLQDAESQA